jgi:hypothetical protein
LSALIWLIAVVNGFAAGVVGATRFDWPHGFWSNHGGWAVVAFVLTPILPFVIAGVNELGERRRRRALEREDNVRTCLVSSLVYLVRQCQADWEQTGVQLFAVRHKRWRQQHVRIAKVRLSSLASSGVVWTKGKGVIGRCWATRQAQFLPVEEYFAKYENLAADAWNELPADARYGLTHDDFQRLRGKYGVIAAVPIIDRKDRYIGCVTLDTPPESAILPHGEVFRSLAGTAEIVKAFLAG